MLYKNSRKKNYGLITLTRLGDKGWVVSNSFIWVCWFSLRSRVSIHWSWSQKNTCRQNNYPILFHQSNPQKSRTDSPRFMKYQSVQIKKIFDFHFEAQKHHLQQVFIIPLLRMIPVIRIWKNITSVQRIRLAAQYQLISINVLLVSVIKKGNIRYLIYIEIANILLYFLSNETTHPRCTSTQEPKHKSMAIHLLEPTTGQNLSSLHGPD